MSKDPKPRRLDEPEPTGDPYIDGRGAWMERYGTYVQQAYNWRLIAMLEAVALVVAVVGVFYLASQTKFVPYVVAIDKLGSAIAVAPADRASPVDSRVVRAQLANWIVKSRSVVTDHLVEHKMVDGVYDFLPPGSAAFGYVNDWFGMAGHDPFARSKTQSDEVTINAILPISPSSYELQWTETLRDLHGKTTGMELWDGTATITFKTPTTEAEVMANPLGMWITSLNWAKKIS